LLESTGMIQIRHAKHHRRIGCMLGVMPGLNPFIFLQR